MKNLDYTPWHQSCQYIFFNLTTKAQKNKNKNKQVGLYPTKDFCIAKNQNKPNRKSDQQNEKATYELVENMYKFYIRQVIIVQIYKEFIELIIKKKKND